MTVPSLPALPTRGKGGTARIAPFMFDSFTGVDGTALASHTGELGATWTVHPSFAADGFLIGNNWRNAAVAGSSVAYASGVPASADYTVTGALTQLTALAGTNTGIIGRTDIAANTYYYARYLPGSTAWQLFKAVAGVLTQLGSDAVQVLTTGAFYTFSLGMAGTTISLVVDGVSKVSVTDTDITAAGRVGVRSAGATITDTTGIHLASIAASR